MLTMLYVVLKCNSIFALVRDMLTLYVNEL